MNDKESGYFNNGFLLGTVVTVLLCVVILAVTSGRRDDTYAELCPTILAEASPTDSLAVFQKHEGCFEFVRREAP